MFTVRRLSACLTLVVLLYSYGNALGQRVRVTPRRGADRSATVDQNPTDDKDGDTKESEAAKDQKADEPQFNPLGDPSKFTRMGGWGGIGSAVGQWGMARTMLIMVPAVQEELALTNSQKEEIRTWMDDMRDRGRQMGEEMRASSEANMRQMNIAGAIQMMGRMTSMFQESERGLGRILNAGQRKRLDQISLQMEGVTALTRADVAEKVQLSEEQLEQIQAIMTQSRMRQMGFWLQQAVAMRETAGRGREASGEEAAKAESEKPEVRTARKSARSRPRDSARTLEEDRSPKSDPPASKEKRKPAADGDEDPVVGDEAAARARRAERTKQFRKQFETMRTGADQIQDETVRAVLKVLAPRQRNTFDKMLGPPFDPNKLTAGWNIRGQERRSEPDAESESETERKAPASKQGDAPRRLPGA